MFEVLIRRRKKISSNKKIDTTSQNELMLAISKAESFSDVRQEFNLLYDSVVQPIWYSLAKKYVPPLTKEDLKDVFQEAWIKILESRKKYNPQYNAFNWIYIIKQNLALDKIRKLYHHSHLVDDENPEEDIFLRIPDEEPIIENKIITEEITALLSEAVESIQDEIEREIFKRRVILGQKFEEISSELGIPMTTVYKKVRKSIDFLKPKVIDILNS